MGHDLDPARVHRGETRGLAVAHDSGLTYASSMARFGRRQSADEAQSWTRIPAEIRDVKYGLVHTTSTGVDAMYDSHTANKN
jgi:hypothetical protein